MSAPTLAEFERLLTALQVDCVAAGVEKRPTDPTARLALLDFVRGMVAPDQHECGAEHPWCEIDGCDCGCNTCGSAEHLRARAKEGRS